MNKIIDEVNSDESNVPKQSYLFSATMTKKVDKLKRTCLKDPVKISVKEDDEVK